MTANQAKFKQFGVVSHAVKMSQVEVEVDDLGSDTEYRVDPTADLGSDADDFEEPARKIGHPPRSNNKDV